jgi:hypothetical protein
MNRYVLSLVLAVMSLAAGSARAAQCIGPSPFSDVAQTDTFCSDALWLRNAQVTLGCGTGTTFCPGETVPRAQMALFLRRLAEAAREDVKLMEEQVFPFPAQDLDTAGVTACESAQITVPAAGSNTREVHAHGSVTFVTNGFADVQLRLTRSNDGGAFAVEHDVQPIVTTPASSVWVSAVVMTERATVLPGTNARWRIELIRSPGSSSIGDVVELRCQLKIHNTMQPT